ncbi:MAG: hypothetical protein LBR85_00115 [Oscillospiraceae bacterium]|jgi:hypothetical protein|nr:hypothetical protein [Oscillospiraceae bacterium]
MSDIASVIIAFFACFGVISLVLAIAALISAPRRGTRWIMFSEGLTAEEVEADMRRAAWLRKICGVPVTLLFDKANLSDAQRRLLSHTREEAD